MSRYIALYPLIHYSIDFQCHTANFVLEEYIVVRGVMCSKLADAQNCRDPRDNFKVVGLKDLAKRNKH